MKKIIIDGVEYVKKSEIKPTAIEVLKDFVIIRTYSAGVHAGYLVSHKDKMVELKNSIRIWKWDGAASLSQLAMEGTNDPDNCKFACPVTKIILTEAIEIINCTKKAMTSIQNVKSWKK